MEHYHDPVMYMNLRLSYVMELCLGLTENPIHPSRSKTPVPHKDK